MVATAILGGVFGAFGEKAKELTKRWLHVGDTPSAPVADSGRNRRARAPKHKTLAPEKSDWPPKPDYNDDVFFGVRWQWRWGFNYEQGWHPYNIEPFCLNSRCDHGMRVDMDFTVGTDSTVFVCTASQCGRRVRCPGHPDCFYVELREKILRNQRNGWRGDPAP
jgi:hypothetical protein